MEKSAARRAVLSAVAVLGLMAGLALEEPAVPAARPIWVIAHRAGAAEAPENTLAALERAIAAGADMAEIDVQRTRDKILVTLHDESLARTTGLDRLSEETDLSEIRGLDAGTWFSGDFAGEPLPTLAAMLDAARDRISLMIEVKRDGRDGSVAEQVVALIVTKGMEDQCVLASASWADLQRSKELAPELKTVWILQRVTSDLWGQPYVDGYSVCADNLTRADVERAHGEGRPIYAWTVNQKSKMKWVLGLGVDGLVTDDPDEAKVLLRGG